MDRCTLMLGTISSSLPGDALRQRFHLRHLTRPQEHIRQFCQTRDNRNKLPLKLLSRDGLDRLTRGVRRTPPEQFHNLI